MFHFSVKILEETIHEMETKSAFRHCIFTFRYIEINLHQSHPLSETMSETEKELLSVDTSVQWHPCAQNGVPTLTEPAGEGSPSSSLLACGRSGGLAGPRPKAADPKRNLRNSGKVKDARNAALRAS